MSLATKNVATVLVGVSVVLALSFAFATPAKADLLSDLQAQVQALLAQISALSGGTTTGGSCNTFTRNHQMGDSGGEVMWVQQFLNSHGAQVSASGAGSPGNESSYFGAKTKAALAKFQAANGIAPAAGYWGPITRAKANSMCVPMTPPTTTPGPTPIGAGVSVVAGTQPANSLAPQSATRVPFTTFTITNNSGAAVTINGITVKRTGLGANAVFAGIVLIDSNGLQIGTAKTLNSNDQAVVGDTWTINPGQSQTFTVAGNMGSSLSSYAGQVVSLSVIGINTTSPVTGSLPITGANQTVNATLSVGSVTSAISAMDPNAAQSKSIGDTGIKFSGVRFTAGSAEDLRLFSVRWRMNGSASASDLGNVMTYVDGTAYPTSVSPDGRYFTTTFPGGILIQKGFSKDVHVQGDIVGSNASGRVVELDIDKTSDVYIVGQTYGYGIAPAAGSGTASTAATHGTTITTSQPWFQGSTFSISGGSATTIGKANEVAAANIAVNVPNQVLGGFVTDIKGEPISVQSLVFTVASSSTTGGAVLTNVSIVDENGAVVAGPIDAAGSAMTTLTFTDTITFPLGRKVYTLKGKVSSNTANGSTVNVSTTPSSGWTNVTGQTTGNTVSLSANGAFTMNTMTIRTASLAVAVSSSPAAQNIVAGGQGVLLANYQFDATQSGEDVRFSSLTLDYDGSDGGFAAAPSKLSSCQLFDGMVALNSGSNVVNPSTTATTTAGLDVAFTLDNGVTVGKGTVKELGLKCNVASSADSASTVQFGISSTNIGAISATGLTSSNSVAPTGATGNGQVMTLSSGALTVSTDSSSPSYQIASGGSTGVTLGVYKFRATNESVNLQRVGLKLTNTASSSASDMVQVTLWSGTTQIGTATFVGSNKNATSTLTSPLLLTKDADTIITVKGNLAAIGSSEAGTSGALIAVDVDVNTNTQGTGVGSGGTVNATGSTAVAGVRLFKSFPVVAEETGSAALASSGVADGKLLRFRVTADSHGPVGIEKFSVTIATTTATVTGINIFAFTDSSYSTPVTGLTSDGRMLATSLTGAAWLAATTELEFWAQTSATASTTIQIPAGTTRYFEIRGSVSGATSGASIVTTLLGDAAYPQLAGHLGTTLTVNNDAGSNNDFIWSPNSTTTSAWADLDWTNGFGVVGLPSGGLSKTRSAN